MKKSKLLKTLAVFAISAGAAIGCFAMVGCNKKGGDGEQQQQQQPEEQKPSIDLSTLTYETTATYTWDANTAYTEAKDINSSEDLIPGVVTALANVPDKDGNPTSNAGFQVKAIKDSAGTVTGYKLNFKGQGLEKGRFLKIALENAAKIVITAKSGSTGKGNCKVLYCTAADRATKIENAGFELVDGAGFEDKTIYSDKGTYYLGSENYTDESGEHKPTMEITNISIFYAV